MLMKLAQEHDLQILMTVAKPVESDASFVISAGKVAEPAKEGA
jgi:putative aminopeptidase FrvX